MASPPSKLPVWATGGSADITEPPTAKKELGWVGGATPDRPPAQYFNWLLNTQYQWLEFFRDLLVLYDINGNWTDQNSGIAQAWTPTDIAYDKDANSSNGLFVVVGYDTGSPDRVIISSPDGETWTVRDNPGSGNDILRAVAYSPTLDLWCAVGQDGVSNEWISTAPGDASTWTQRTAPGTDALNDVVWDPVSALFVAVGENERIYSSTDGITWTNRNSGGTNPFIAVDVDPSGNFVAVGQNGRLGISSNGTTWTTYTTGGVPFLARRVLFIQRLNGGSGLWVAAGGAGGSQIAISTTGAQLSWTEITGHGISGSTITGMADDPKNQRLIVTASDGGMFVWLGDQDPANNDEWTSVQSDTDSQISGIALNDFSTINQNRYWVRCGPPDSGETGGLTQIAKSANPLF